MPAESLHPSSSSSDMMVMVMVMVMLMMLRTMQIPPGRHLFRFRRCHKAPAQKRQKCPTRFFPNQRRHPCRLFHLSCRFVHSNSNSSSSSESLYSVAHNFHPHLLIWPAARSMLRPHQKTPFGTRLCPRSDLLSFFTKTTLTFSRALMTWCVHFHAVFCACVELVCCVFLTHALCNTATLSASCCGRLQRSRRLGCRSSQRKRKLCAE